MDRSNTREDSKQSSIEYTYQYDKVSNRVSKSVNGIKTEYAYNNRNQLISEKTGEDTVTYDYDPNGNLINKNENGISTIYSYDDFNRMIISLQPRIKTRFILILYWVLLSL